MPDRNFYCITDRDGFDIPELILDLPAQGIDASQYDDILKFSNSRNGRIGRLIIRTGGTQRENAIDFNRGCSNIRIAYAEIEAGRQNAITVKGGCRNIIFGGVDITHAGGHCDVELGNHSDQVYAKTTGVAFGDLYRDDGKPVRIRWGFADKPEVEHGAVEWQWFSSLLIRAYVWAKHVAPILPLLLVMTGCSLWPSTWRLGGSPLEKNERAQSRLESAQAAAVTGAQAAVHKAGMALETAPAENRSVVVARDFVGEAEALLDQAHGAPAANDVAKWRELVTGLVSENAAIREAAERQRVADGAVTADLARRLASATSAAQRANERALEYARESEALADFARKLKLGFFAIVGLLVLGTVLSVAARFFPQLGLAARVVNGVVAPGMTYVASRAEEGLKRVGQGIANLRKTAGAAAEQLIQANFDGVTDADHQAIISSAASAAGAPPPAAP